MLNYAVNIYDEGTVLSIVVDAHEVLVFARTLPQPYRNIYNKSANKALASKRVRL